jgi:hypothetical protein
MQALVAVSLALVACTHGGTSPVGPASTWNAPEQLGHVPADTPYMFARLATPPEGSQLSSALDARVIEFLDKAAQVPLTARMTLDPADRAMLALADEMRGNDPTQWWENLGFAHHGHWVAYGLGMWPVVRIEVADATRARGLVERAVQLVPDVHRRQLGTTAYWLLPAGKNVGVAAVLDRELVAAILPGAQYERMLPLVFDQLPATSIRTTRDVPELMRRHHLASNLLGFVDTRRFVAGIPQIDESFEMLATPACRDDIARITALAPRIAFGYADAVGKDLDGRFVVELEPALAAELAKLRTVLPAPPQRPLFALSAAIDVDAAIELARTWGRRAQARPFTCAPLAELDHAIADAMHVLDRPLPPEAHGLRGVQLVVDDAQLSPPTGTGHVVIAGDQVATALTSVLRQVPGMGALNVGPDGRPYELPLGILGAFGVSGLKGYVAMRAGRAAIAIGEHADTDVTAALAAPNDDRTPLVRLVWDVKKFIARFPSLMATPDAQRWRAFSLLDVRLDVREDSLVLDFDALPR